MNMTVRKKTVEKNSVYDDSEVDEELGVGENATSSFLEPIIGVNFRLWPPYFLARATEGTSL